MKKSWQRSLVIGVLGLLLVTVLPASAEDQESIKALRSMGKAFASIAEKASPAVVGVKAEKVYTGRSRGRGEQMMPFDDEFFEWFFGPQRRRRSPQRQESDRRPRQTSQGTGFLVSADGYILTNNHLVGLLSSEEDVVVEKVLVMLEDGHEVEAKVIGTDPETDVAVIKIKGDDHPYIELADSDAVEVGEWVIAIGNPFGFTHTVTSGIVSAKGRNVGLNAYDDFIQTDAAINPGNSGGPLLNLDGKVVGINSAIYGPMGNIGIGLAIPTNLAKSIYEQLVENGEVARGFLGVQPEDVSYEIADKLNLEDTKGALIEAVTEDSAADRAGFEVYDIVLEFNGQKIKDAKDFRYKVAQVPPGKKVTILVLRDGKQKLLTAVLDRRSEALAKYTPEAVEEDTSIGIEVRNLTDDLAERYGYEDMEGILITDVKPSSDAYRKGLRPDMLIIEAEFKPVKNTSQFKKLVEQAKEDGVIALRVHTGRMKKIVSVKIED
jgi:serine protease Do